jgi:hypothetical protein
MRILGIKFLLSKMALVKGDVLWFFNHYYIADLSYVCPSEVITGSKNISLVIGQ